MGKIRKGNNTILVLFFIYIFLKKAKINNVVTFKRSDYDEF